MTVEIKYKDLIDRCEQLSSFESEGKVDAAGQSRYLEIHINEVDKLLVKQYIEQARAIMEEKFDRMITDSKTTTTDDRKVLSFKGYFTAGEQTILGADITNPLIGYFEESEVAAGPMFLLYEKTFDGYIVSNSLVGADWYDRPNDEEFIYVDDLTGSRYVWKDAKLIPYEESEYSGQQTIFWTIRTDTRWKGNTSFAKHASEAIVAYAMSAWLSDKLPERVSFYDVLFTASTEMAVKNIFKKQVPRYEE